MGAVCSPHVSPRKACFEALARSVSGCLWTGREVERAAEWDFAFVCFLAGISVSVVSFSCFLLGRLSAGQPKVQLQARKMREERAAAGKK